MRDDARSDTGADVGKGTWSASRAVAHMALLLLFCFAHSASPVAAAEIRKRSAESSAADLASVRMLQLAQSWDQLTPDQRDRARRNFEAYKKLPPDRRKDVDRRFDRWKSMGSGEKARVRRNYDSYRQMSPDQRRDFGRRYQLYKRDHQR